MRPSRSLMRPGISVGRRWAGGLVAVPFLLALALTLPMATRSQGSGEGPAIVVTTGVLGAVVRDLVGDRAPVTVLMGDGVDPHDWAPSAQDVEAIHRARLVVINGLGLEASLGDALDEASASSVPVFVATDHIIIRGLGPDASGSPQADPSLSEPPGHDDGHAHGALDPHFWLDPLSMRDVVLALGPVLSRLGVEAGDRQADLVTRLEALDGEVRTILAAVPPERRRLVTGHESMGYFAARYGFDLVGSVIPGLSSQGEVSAGQLRAIVTTIREQGVPVVFTEVGTPQMVVDAIVAETGVRVVGLPSHRLPADGSYLTFIRDIATTIAGALG